VSPAPRDPPPAREPDPGATARRRHRPRCDLARPRRAGRPLDDEPPHVAALEAEPEGGRAPLRSPPAPSIAYARAAPCGLVPPAVLRQGAPIPASASKDGERDERQAVRPGGDRRRPRRLRGGDPRRPA